MGNNDIVYFVKASAHNEELRYSLRSVEQNFPHRKVWIYGGKPSDIEPDEFVPIRQVGSNKWEKVRNMLWKACQNPDITDDFFLFNDDFFVMHKIESYEPIFDGTVYQWIISVEGRNFDAPTAYTLELRKMIHELEHKGITDELKNYAVHMPMLVNKSKMIDVIREFDSPMFRNIYGNYWHIGGTNLKDMKILRRNQVIEEDAPYLSSDDNAFMFKEIGQYIKNKFQGKSRFEK